MQAVEETKNNPCIHLTKHVNQVWPQSIHIPQDGGKWADSIFCYSGKKGCIVRLDRRTLEIAKELAPITYKGGKHLSVSDIETDLDGNIYVLAGGGVSNQKIMSGSYLWISKNDGDTWRLVGGQEPDYIYNYDLRDARISAIAVSPEGDCYALQTVGWPPAISILSEDMEKWSHLPKIKELSFGRIEFFDLVQNNLMGAQDLYISLYNQYTPKDRYSAYISTDKGKSFELIPTKEHRHVQSVSRNGTIFISSNNKKFSYINGKRINEGELFVRYLKMTKGGFIYNISGSDDNLLYYTEDAGNTWKEFRLKEGRFYECPELVFY